MAIQYQKSETCGSSVPERLKAKMGQNRTVWLVKQYTQLHCNDNTTTTATTSNNSCCCCCCCNSAELSAVCCHIQIGQHTPRL